MAFFDNMFSGKSEIDIDEFLNNMDVEEEVEDVDFYVKPISLQTDSDLEQITKELNEKNLVLLDIKSISKRNPKKTKEIVGQIKMYIKDIKGDIAMVSKNKLLLVPTKVKIIKQVK